MIEGGLVVIVRGIATRFVSEETHRYGKRERGREGGRGVPQSSDPSLPPPALLLSSLPPSLLPALQSLPMRRWRPSTARLFLHLFLHFNLQSKAIKRQPLPPSLPPPPPPPPPPLPPLPPPLSRRPPPSPRAPAAAAATAAAAPPPATTGRAAAATTSPLEGAREEGVKCHRPPSILT